MSAARGTQVLVCFAQVEDACVALDELRAEGVELSDAYAPYPLPALTPCSAQRDKSIIFGAMTAGLGAGAAVFLLQCFSSLEYPYVVGGKPLLSWPAFMPVTATVAALAAVVSTMVILLWRSALPKPHHALFASQLYQRRCGDGVFLLLLADDAQALAKRLQRDYQPVGVEVMLCA